MRGGRRKISDNPADAVLAPLVCRGMDRSWPGDATLRASVTQAAGSAVGARMREVARDVGST